MAKRDTIGAKLTAAKVKSLLAKQEAGRYGDGRGGHGLILIVSPKGAGRWIQRVSINGKVKDLTIGGCRQVTLAAAREQAAINYDAIQTGGGPGLRTKSGAPTFKEAMGAVIGMKRQNWRPGKSPDQWRSTLSMYAKPLLTMPVDRITRKDILACLEAPTAVEGEDGEVTEDSFWQAKPVTARNVYRRISAIMDWAVAHEHREYNPVSAAVIKHGLGLQKAEVKHHRALPHAEVSAAIAKVRATHAYRVTKLAFEFLILTAARSGEVRGAVWGEIDLEAAVWTIPAARMKMNKEHRVPLSPRALEVLGEARKLHNGDLVFPSPNGKRQGDATLSKLLRDLGIAAVPHGFRSSFRNWAGELSGASHEACERALAHTVRNQAEAAYNRTDLLDQRRKLMDDWADYLAA